MNDVFGISPNTDISADVLGLLLARFGFHQGRFIGRIPKNWMRLMYDQVEKLPDVERKRCRLLLERNRHVLLKVSATYDTSRGWEQNCRTLLAGGEIAGVIARGEGDVADWFSLEQVGRGELPDASGALVQGTARNLVAAMEVVLQTSLEVYVIDPYLSVASQRYWPFLRELISSKYARDTIIYVFSRFEKMDTKEPFVSLSKRCFRDCIPALGCRLAFVPVCGAEQQGMHGRYAFNVHGGITFDRGFQELLDARVDISTMSPGLHMRYFEQYSRWARRRSQCYVYPPVAA